MAPNAPMPRPGSAPLEVVGLDDVRIGCAWHTYVGIAERRGQSPGSMAHLIRRAGLRPVAVIRGRPGRVLFDERDLVDAGIWPEHPLRNDVECWMSEYATRRGLPKSRVEEVLRRRLALRLGVAGPVEPDALSQEGIARRIGNRWVVNIEAADALLDATYDPTEEATSRELLADFPGYASVSWLAAALKRGGVPHRPVLSSDGRRVVVFDRAEATRWASGRYVPVPRAARESAPDPLLRSSVGPIELRAPTTLTTIRPADAAWLLGMDANGLRSSRAGDSDRAGSGVVISRLEEELARAEDFEGFLLLAAIVDGVFSPRAGEDRTCAILRLREKRGQAR